MNCFSLMGLLPLLQAQQPIIQIDMFFINKNSLVPSSHPNCPQTRSSYFASQITLPCPTPKRMRKTREPGADKQNMYASQFLPISTQGSQIIGNCSKLSEYLNLESPQLLKSQGLDAISSLSNVSHVSHVSNMSNVSNVSNMSNVSHVSNVSSERQRKKDGNQASHLNSSINVGPLCTDKRKDDSMSYQHINISINQPEQMIKCKEIIAEKDRQINILCEALQQRTEDYHSKMEQMERDHEGQVADLIRLYSLEMQKCKQLMKILEEKQFQGSESGEEHRELMIRQSQESYEQSRDEKETFSFGPNALKKIKDRATMRHSVQN